MLFAARDLAPSRARWRFPHRRAFQFAIRLQRSGKPTVWLDRVSMRFLIVRFLPIVTGQHQDIRPFVLITFLAFLGASFYRNLRARTHWLSASTGVVLGGVTQA